MAALGRLYCSRVTAIVFNSRWLVVLFDGIPQQLLDVCYKQDSSKQWHIIKPKPETVKQQGGGDLLGVIFIVYSLKLSDVKITHSFQPLQFNLDLGFLLRSTDSFFF